MFSACRINAKQTFKRQLTQQCNAPLCSLRGNYLAAHTTGVVDCRGDDYQDGTEGGGGRGGRGRGGGGRGGGGGMRQVVMG